MNPFYSRLEPTSLDATFFPVELRPLYWDGEADGRTRQTLCVGGGAKQMLTQKHVTK